MLFVHVMKTRSAHTPFTTQLTNRTATHVMMGQGEKKTPAFYDCLLSAGIIIWQAHLSEWEFLSNMIRSDHLGAGISMNTKVCPGWCP